MPGQERREGAAFRLRVFRILFGNKCLCIDDICIVSLECFMLRSCHALAVGAFSGASEPLHSFFT